MTGALGRNLAAKANASLQGKDSSRRAQADAILEHGEEGTPNPTRAASFVAQKSRSVHMLVSNMMFCHSSILDFPAENVDQLPCLYTDSEVVHLKKPDMPRKQKPRLATTEQGAEVGNCGKTSLEFGNSASNVSALPGLARVTFSEQRSR
ncbi:hypothetical protein BDZ45DRAFT_740023 [Acephala macrosclerotiorum]|nr:hypothetical protein BDZ45DRAFT_740023 [Acephala macrosclerotiorum]